VVVGGLNTLFGYGSFAALNYWLTGRIPYPYMVANLLANIAAITFAFIGYKYFVFRTKGNLLREYLRTYLVYGSSTLFGLALLPALVFALGFVIHRPSVVPYVAQAIGTVLVVTTSFFGHKKYSFRA
jgi:putative flippase GtrA